jgi:hypothetical protein
MKLEADGFLYAQLVNPNEYKSGATAWFGKEISPLQGSVMKYDTGKAFRTHIHILNPRIINKTQECFIVVSGKVKVTISVSKCPTSVSAPHIVDKFVPARMVDMHGKEYYTIGSLEAGPGEAIFVWGGYHKIEILENNTVAYEIKAGQFNGVVSDDKEFLDEIAK